MWYRFTAWNSERLHGWTQDPAIAQAVVDRLNAALNQVLADPGVRDKLLVQGSEAVGGTPEALGKVVTTELARWAVVARQAQIKID